MQQTKDEAPELARDRDGELREAMAALDASIRRKSDYAPALFLRGQVFDRQGKIAEAQTTLAELFRAQLGQLRPDQPIDAGLAFQLGFLFYKDQKFDEAQKYFRAAVDEKRGAPNYSNARYFLGLILDREGKKAEAIGQFEQIAALNPDNREVTRILANLHSGLDALANIVPPEPPPEERTEAPVEDTGEPGGGQNLDR
ncbi:MAG: tetratricopeptide repeat protein [Parcubacteria group bacterium]|nr:tetratricopeptide repeat protein [Parcubacteria group bacterium]